MAICRVPKHDEISLTTALDAGCAGIVIPHVETAQEVKDFMKEMYFGGTSPFLLFIFPMILKRFSRRQRPPFIQSLDLHSWNDPVSLPQRCLPGADGEQPRLYHPADRIGQGC